MFPMPINSSTGSEKEMENVHLFTSTVPVCLMGFLSKKDPETRC